MDGTIEPWSVSSGKSGEFPAFYRWCNPNYYLTSYPTNTLRAR